jgi:hypothetical protein
VEISPLFTGDPDGITISQQPGYQKTVSEWCERVYAEAKHELDQNEEIMGLDKSISFLLGKQWSEKRPTYKSSPVSNRVWSNLIQLVSYLTDLRPSFEIKASNKTYDEQCVLLNKLSRSWFYNRDIDLVLSQIVIHAATTIGYGRLSWNPELCGGMGDMELTAVGPTDLIPIKPANHLQNSRGVIYQTVKELSWFRDKFPITGQHVKPDPSLSRFSKTSKPSGAVGRAWEVIGPAMRRVLSASSSVTNDSVMPLARLREYWLHDDQLNTSGADVYVGDLVKGYGYKVSPGQKLYPRGRLITMGGDTVVYDGPNPFYHGQFPFCALRLNQVPWSWLGVSEFRNQIPLQESMNHILAGIMDSVKRAVNPPLLSPSNAFGDAVKKNIDPNMPNAMIYYNPNTIAPPQYASSPSLPGFVFETMLYFQRELDSQSGFLDLQGLTRRGIIPAGDTIESLKQNQQTMVRLKVRYIEGFFKELGTQFVSNAFQFYTMKRRIHMLGSEGLTFEDFDLDPETMIPAEVNPEVYFRNFGFYVAPGSLLDSNRTQKALLMLQLRRMGDMDLKNLLEALDLGSMYDSIKKNLQGEGADFLINAIKQKMGGGAPSAEGMSPQQAQQLSSGNMGTAGSADQQNNG